jgi:hypothetical protein
VLRTSSASSSPVVRTQFLVLMHKLRTNMLQGYDGVDPVATINTANPTTTEFHIACPTGVDSTECGWGPGLDVTILSKTRYQAQMKLEDLSMSLGCDYNSQATEMSCTVNQKGGNDDTGGQPVTAVLSGTDVEFLSATVVKGAELLSATGSATPTPTGSAASTTVVTSAKSASTGLMMASGSAPASMTSMASASKSGSPSASSSAHATASTGAAVKYGIEGSALLALAGAAAFML